jgi:hypothetical protein
MSFNPRLIERHEFFELLDVAKPRWSLEFKYLRDAAISAGLLAEFNDYLQTPQGIAYLQFVEGTHDHLADNEARKAEIEANITLAAQAGFRFRGAAE